MLAISLGLRSDSWLLAVISPIGAILAWALFMDAIQSERMANEILLDSIADRRVSSPSVERLQTEAASLASRTQPEQMSTLAMTRAITDHRLRRSLPRSGPPYGPRDLTAASRTVVLEEPLTGRSGRRLSRAAGPYLGRSERGWQPASGVDTRASHDPHDPRARRSWRRDASGVWWHGSRSRRSRRAGRERKYDPARCVRTSHRVTDETGHPGLTPARVALTGLSRLRGSLPRA